MSLHQVNSAFNLLGQNPEPAKSVHLPGPDQPTLQVSWGSFHQGWFRNLAAVFTGPTYSRKFIYKDFFKDAWIEGRIPYLALLVALILHVVLVIIPFPKLLTAIKHNPAFDNTELTWSGSIDDLPLLNLASSKAKHASSANRPAPNGADAFHPRQRIFTDSTHPNHPRQTLINPAAPMQPPKILPPLPNIVQLQQSAQARPHVLIDQQALAKLHPRQQRTATSKVAPPADAPFLQQQQVADLNIAASPNAPARPKLALNAGSAPRQAQRNQSGEATPAPELAASGSGASTLIALSAAPAPPAASVVAPSGNLAARVAISPEGKKPGTPGGAADAGTKATPGGGSGTSPVAVSISGGNPTPKTNVSGLGGGSGKSGNFSTKLDLSIPRDTDASRAKSAPPDEPQAHTAPNFATLGPDARPEQIFNSRKIFTLNVNMPNLNSATGSWILNFAELRSDGSSHLAGTSLASPALTKKVDPKYPPTLAADRVEGEIVLYAVIRKDGSVDSIQVVRSLDQQLDANATSALSQWKFRPATRSIEGVDTPIELEAIVHIPFHAAPGN
ncbi:MAG TPA: energy transducer TonB [Candidatus Dormibacteraeota bacterium]|nr:energy transducer TonB [Candidatus Dormibacteraeota bacterium]